VEKKNKILPATHLLHLSIINDKKQITLLKKQLQINLRRRGRRREWIKAEAAAAATYYSAMNEKLAAIGKRNRLSKKSTFFHGSSCTLFLCNWEQDFLLFFGLDKDLNQNPVFCCFICSLHFSSLSSSSSSPSPAPTTPKRQMCNLLLPIKGVLCDRQKELCVGLGPKSGESFLN
jgi:hypothetical protein